MKLERYQNCGGDRSDQKKVTYYIYIIQYTLQLAFVPNFIYACETLHYVSVLQFGVKFIFLSGSGFYLVTPKKGFKKKKFDSDAEELH